MTVYHTYDGIGERRWICVLPNYDPQEKLSKEEAQKLFKKDPKLINVDVYQHSKIGHGFELIGSVNVWHVGKKAVPAEV